MIVNRAEAFGPSISPSRRKIDELDTKAALKPPLSVAINAAQLDFDCDGVIIQLMCRFQVSVESLPAVHTLAHSSASGVVLSHRHISR